VVIDAGVTKAVEIGVDQLIAIARGCGNKVDTSKLTPSRMSVSEVESDGIEWSKLCEFLESIIKSTPKVSAAELRERAAADCEARFQPICRQLGFREPRVDLLYGCTGNRSREAFETGTGCVWTGTSCSPGGTKEVFRR
jgi:hypothetical protein